MGAADQSGRETGEHSPRRSYWIWPLRPSPRTGAELLRFTAAARPLTLGWQWPLLAVAVGLVPLLLARLLSLSWHQAVTGLLLAPLLWACVRDDRFGKALAIL